MPTSRLISLRSALIPLALLLAATASPAQESPAQHTLSPYFFVQGGDPGTDRLPLLGTRVTVRIAGVIAEVTVRQTYKNDGVRPIHARYVFPASTRAAVHGLTMTIGDQRIRAKIKERELAKREFVAAKRAGKNAALLEQQRPNVFSMDVANILPGQRVEVELNYSELLIPTAGEYEFVYPTVVGPRYSTKPAAGATDSDQWLRTPYTHAGTPPSSTLELTGVVAAGLPVQEVSSPSHPIVTQRPEPSRVQFSLDPSETRSGDRDFVLRYRLGGDRLESGLLLYRGAEENFFLTMIQPPRRVTLDEVPPREYIFVVDVSGSMHGFPLNTAKVLLRDLLGQLRVTDRFNVLLFSGGSRLLSESSLSATSEHVGWAVATLEQQSGGGGTELLPAVERALALPGDEGGRSRSILVVTDGYIGAERELFTTIRENLGRANVFCFGIGSSVNRQLVEGIARAGIGEAFVALDPVGARAVATRFREYVQYPLLTDVRAAFDGFEVYDVQPTSLPDVMAERPIVIFGKWRGEPRGQVVVTGSSGTGDFRRTLSVSHVAPDTSNRALRYLWARARIAELSDFGDTSESDETRRQLVSLGLSYGLLTRHTSFIAVHEVVRESVEPGEDVVQPLPLPAGVSDLAVGGMGSGDEPGLAWLFAVMLIAGLGLCLRPRSLAAGV